CNTHPHNFYLEAATSSGVPGLLLFAGMTVTWLVLLGRSLNGNAVRVGLFLTALLEAWPLASTSEFFSVPNVGWVFLMLGWGFAELRAGAADAGDPRASSVVPDIPEVVTVS
ncbi:MAG: O-antigen ligase family protein, partial [Acidisphaera sp.]|nr:O-antigen ligase family protein [Acidisphaera sp.]